MEQKIQKKFFVSEIIVSLKKRILFIGSQCVNKQSQ